MELGELLAELRTEDLNEAQWNIRRHVARGPSFEFKSNRTSKDELIEYFETWLAFWSPSAAARLLREINKTPILIEDPTHVPIATVLGLFPTDMLEQVAQKFGVDISDKPSGKRISGKRIFSRTAEVMSESLPNSKNASHWFVVAKLAEFVTQYQATEGIHSFCPDCKEDNPREADHCMSCGRELPQITCPKCETANPPQAKFCMGCGEER